MTEKPDHTSVADTGICVITHPLAAAGENATRSLLDILSTLTSVTLITANLPADSEIWNQFEVHEITQKSAGKSVPVAALRFLLNQFRMCYLIFQRDEETILFFGATSYLLPMLWARVLGKVVLVEPRGDVPLTLRLEWEERMPSAIAGFLAGIVKALEQAGFATTDGVITYTPNMARQLDLDPTSSDVYPHGARYVQTDIFEPKGAFEDRGNRIGFLGRLDGEKGIRTLAAGAKHLPEDVTFTFVGDGNLSGWLREELDEEIEQGTVELRGWVDHDRVPAELNRLRLLVMPSEPTEGLPTTILEALACGTPVYATPVSGVPDVVREDETGFLMHEQSPKSIADRITEILSKKSLTQISENGRNLIEREYSFSAAVERYERIFEQVHS